VDPGGGVMIDVIPLNMTEIRIPKAVEVDAVMDPFLTHISQDYSAQKHRRRVAGKNKTQRSGHDE
jgi:hypothetical protein